VSPGSGEKRPNELARGTALDEEGGGSGAFGGTPEARLVAAGKHDDAGAAVELADCAGGLETVELRRLELEEDGIGPEQAGELDRLPSVQAGADDVEAARLEQLGEHESRFRVVPAEHHAGACLVPE
jgi:hypothetical protein